MAIVPPLHGRIAIRPYDMTVMAYCMQIFLFYYMWKGRVDKMNTLVSVAIVPIGAGDSLSKHVAEIVRVIEASGLPNRTTAMSTEIEGDWDDVMKVVKEATTVLTSKGIRTSVILRADIRPGRTNTINSKIEKLDSILGDAADRTTLKADTGSQ